MELAAKFRFMEPPGPSNIENDAHGIEKPLLINSSKLNKFLHSEVNLLIQHIIVQDQDGHNNNLNVSFTVKRKIANLL